MAREAESMASTYKQSFKQNYTIYRNGPSRENAVQKRPQAFLNCQYKNFISAKYAQSNAEGILNRSPHREQVNKKPVRKNSHWLVCD